MLIDNLFCILYMLEIYDINLIYKLEIYTYIINILKSPLWKRSDIFIKKSIKKNIKNIIYILNKIEEDKTYDFFEFKLILHVYDEKHIFDFMKIMSENKDNVGINKLNFLSRKISHIKYINKLKTNTFNNL